MIARYRFLPPVYLVEDRIGTANARHDLFGVRIWKHLSEFEAVLAQEVYEWRFLRLRGLILMLPIFGLFAVVEGPAIVLLAPLLLAAHLSPKLYRPWHRLMELRGHMIEVLVAVDRYGANFETKLANEAAVLTGYEQFRGWDAGRIATAMLAERSVCERWLRSRSVRT